MKSELEALIVYFGCMSKNARGRSLSDEGVAKWKATGGSICTHKTKKGVDRHFKDHKEGSPQHKRATKLKKLRDKAKAVRDAKKAKDKDALKKSREKYKDNWSKKKVEEKKKSTPIKEKKDPGSFSEKKKSLREAYASLSSRDNNKIFEFPVIYKEMKKNMPGLTVSEFKSLIDSAVDSGEYDSHPVDNSTELKEKEFGIWSDHGDLYYLSERK